MSAAPHVSLPVFRCVPLSTTLAPRGCADRHERAARQVEHGCKHGETHLIGAECCASCAVGQAHLRGELPSTWADGAPVERFNKPIGAGTPEAARRLPEPTKEVGMPGKAERITHAGESLTAEQWGTRLGISGAAILARLAKGWPIEKAVTTGRTGHGGIGAVSKGRSGQASRPKSPTPAPSEISVRHAGKPSRTNGAPRSADPIQETLAALRDRRAKLELEMGRVDTCIAALEELDS